MNKILLMIFTIYLESNFYLLTHQQFSWILIQRNKKINKKLRIETLK